MRSTEPQAIHREEMGPCAAQKVIWGFYFGGDTARGIIPPVVIGAVICNGVLVYLFRGRRVWAASSPQAS